MAGSIRKNILARTAGLVLILLFACFVLLQFPRIQTKLAKDAVEKLQTSLDGTIHFSSLKVTPFNTIVIKDFCIVDNNPYIEDKYHRGWKTVDTLAKAGQIAVTMSFKGLVAKNGIQIKRLYVKDGELNIVTEPDRKDITNINRILHSPDPPLKAEETPDIFHVKKVHAQNFHFTLRNFAPPVFTYQGFGLNWDNLECYADAKAHDVGFSKGKMYGTADKCHVLEAVTGYEIYDITGHAEVGMGHARIEDIHFTDRWSDVNVALYSMTYLNSYSFITYVNDVLMEGIFRKTRLSMQTMRYFMGSQVDNMGLYEIDRGHLKGTVDNFQVENLHFHDLHSGIEATVNGGAKGIPVLSESEFDIRLGGVRFTTRGISTLINDWGQGADVDISEVAGGKTFIFNGTGKGPLNDMTLDGSISGKTGLARFRTDIRNIVQPEKAVTINGNIRTKDLDLGEILGTDILGPADVYASLYAELGANPTLKVDSLRADKLTALGYAYTGIKGKGGLGPKGPEGHLSISDPNLQFNFSGNAEKFIASLDYANLAATNIDRRGGTSKASVRIAAEIHRMENSPKRMGDISVRDIILENDSGRHDVGDLLATYDYDSGKYSLTLDSDFAKGKYEGSSPLQTLPALIGYASAAKELPSLFKTPPEDFSGEECEIDLNFLDSRSLLSFVKPGLYIAEGTSLGLSLNRSGNILGRIQSQRLALNSDFIKEMDFNFDNMNGSLNGIITSDMISLSGIEMKNASFTANSDNDSFGLSFHCDGGSSSDNNAELLLNGTISRDESGILTISAHPHSSSVKLNGNLWKLSDSDISFNGSRLQLDSFRVSSGEQVIRLEGAISKSKRDTLRADISEFDASIANIFTGGKLGINGTVNGKAVIISPALGAFGLMGSLRCDGLEIDGNKAGDIMMATTWDDTNGRLNVYLKNTTDERDAINLKGYYTPANGGIDAEAKIDAFDIRSAAPFLSNLFNGMSGKIYGEIEAKGQIDAPELSSRNLRMEDVRLGVAFTGAEYILNGPVELDNTGITLSGVRIGDNYGGSAILGGGLSYDRLKDPSIDVKLSMNDLNILDNAGKSGINGKLTASGNAIMNGPLKSIHIDADVRTGEGSIHVPLESRVESETSELLTFIQKENDNDPYEEMLNEMSQSKGISSDISANIRVEASPEVEAFLEIDKASGNILSGNGQGKIDVELRTADKYLNLGGDYTMIRGKYQFATLGNLIRKDFTIKNGSSLKFNGDILDTELDVSSIYSLRTTLAALAADTTAVSSRRLVNCGIEISDKLRNPKLTFSIDIPDLDPTTKSLTDAALNTEDKVQKQFIALLLTGSFVPSENSGVVYNNAFVLFKNLSDIVSGQINSIFQRLEIPLDLGLSYIKNEIGTDIFDVAVSTQLFNNRVEVNGTLGNRQYSTTRNNDNVVGNLDINIKMDNSGKFLFNLFSHSADPYTNYLDNSQRNGLGITYQREYNHFVQLIRDIFSSKSERKKREAQETARSRKQVIIKIEEDE